MKVTIESTTRMVEVTMQYSGAQMMCRVWEGVTESGVKVQMMVPRVACLASENQAEFEAELLETRAPMASVLAFPLRMVL